MKKLLYSTILILILTIFISGCAFDRTSSTDISSVFTLKNYKYYIIYPYDISVDFVTMHSISCWLNEAGLRNLQDPQQANPQIKTSEILVVFVRTETGFMILPNFHHSLLFSMSFCSINDAEITFYDLRSNEVQVKFKYKRGFMFPYFLYEEQLDKSLEIIRHK